MFSVLLAISILALCIPSVGISPSVITTAYSSRSDELSGYGLRLQIERASIGYYRVIHSYRTPEKLERPGCVQVIHGIANLWELNYDIWQKGNHKIGVGINKVSNKRIGWQVFGETNVDSSITIRIGFRQIYISRDTTLLTAGFSLNL